MMNHLHASSTLLSGRAEKELPEWVTTSWLSGLTRGREFLIGGAAPPVFGWAQNE